MRSEEVTEEQDLAFSLEDSIVIGDGHLSIVRRPVPVIQKGFRLATHAELMVANLSRPFPWGNMSNDTEASRLWKNGRIGFGGLCHKKWFVTSDGRFGGALNVPTNLPGSLRCSLLIDGGKGSEEENEGFALVRETDDRTREMFRRVQIHALQHVVADGGHIVVSPVYNRLDGALGARVGFVGRCQKCPNAELISFEQLKEAVPQYTFELFPEWKNWRV